jgi:1-deoxy-D-xylulose-5-phosphate synthase
VTVEENIISGGFGAAVMEYLSTKSAKNTITLLAIPNSFIEHAERQVLITRYGLDAHSIETTVRKAIAL